MNYYEAEFKLKVVKEYLTGLQADVYQVKKYGLSSNALIYNWKHVYQPFDKADLETHSSPTKYTSEFKRDVLNFIETTGASFSEAARQYAIPNGGMVSRCIKISSWQSRSLVQL